jgi:hypothetical protein
MNRISVKTFTAHFTLGLYTGYSDKVISIDTIKQILTDGQERIKKKSNIFLSAKLALCHIVFLGQDEPSVEIQFIQYPKFPADENALKVAITEIAISMMEKLEQNRTVIVFPDETVMVEQTSEIDPRIM